MNKTKLKNKIVKCDIFKCEAHFIYDCTVKELEKFVEKKYKLGINWDWLEGADGTVIVENYDNGEYKGICRIVWVRKLNKTPMAIGRLAHEVIHLCVRILEDKGIPYDSYRNADETLAYLSDYFIREVYND